VGEKSLEKTLQSIMIQSQSEFATAVVLLSREDCHKHFEKSKEPYCHALYYEVTIETGGIAQVGWASLAPCEQGNHGQGFSPNSDSGDGVGDDDFSYGFDGLRGKIFHNGLETDYGLPQTATPWKKGDIVGCLYDRRNRTISFSVNGNNYGNAFDVDEKLTDQWLSPAISINEKEVVVVNLGPIFRHAPPTDRPLPVSFLLNTDSTTVDSTDDEKVEDVNVAPDENTKSSVYLDLAGIPLPSLKDSSTAVDIDIKKARVNNCSSKNVDDHGTSTSQDFNLDDYNSPNDLKVLGMEKLKQELYKLGCKCGGSLEERANRLFSLKGLERDQIPQKLRGQNFHEVQLLLNK
jgi:SPRY domain.